MNSVTWLVPIDLPRCDMDVLPRKAVPKFDSQRIADGKGPGATLSPHQVQATTAVLPSSLDGGSFPRSSYCSNQSFSYTEHRHASNDTAANARIVGYSKLGPRLETRRDVIVFQTCATRSRYGLRGSVAGLEMIRSTSRPRSPTSGLQARLTVRYGRFPAKWLSNATDQVGRR
jgi:hypothetical protein